MNRYLINEFLWCSMPKFIDSHDMKGVNKETLKKLQKEPKDEFGVSHINIMFNEDEDRIFCFLDAPNKEAVEKHHAKFGYKCDYISEVDTTVE